MRYFGQTQLISSTMAGLAFGCATAVVVLPVAYFLGALKGGMMLSLASGLAVGLLMGWFSFAAAKILESRIKLAADETLIHQGPASLLRGKRTVGGWLYLTSRRLAFAANHVTVGERWPAYIEFASGEMLIEHGPTILHCGNMAQKFWFYLTSRRLTLAANDITSSELLPAYSLSALNSVSRCVTRFLQRNGIRVETVFHEQGDGETFIVHDSKRWERQILSAMAASPEPKTWTQEFYNEAPRSTVSAVDYLQLYGAFPLPNRACIRRNTALASGQVDLGWCCGTIYDGQYERPLWVETWADEGHVTNQTYFFSSIGLEDLSAAQALDKLRSGGAIACVAHTPCELLRINDCAGHPTWSFNICLAAGDNIYVTQSPPYQPYPAAQSAYAHCIVCGAAEVEPLFAVSGRGVPHGQPGHKYVYDYNEISHCTKCGNGQLEMLSHDCWSHDEAHDMYWWYAITADDMKEWLAPTAEFCNVPLAANCDCTRHQSIKQQFQGVKPSDAWVSDVSRISHYYWLKPGLVTSGATQEIDRERGVQNVASLDGA